MGNVARLWAAIERTAPALGYPHIRPGVVFAQAAHETAGFTSQRWHQDRNPYGLKYPHNGIRTIDGKVVPTLATGIRNDHAIFPSVEAATVEYFNRQRDFKIPDTSDVSRYMRATADSGYATDPAYLTLWGNWIPRTAGAGLRVGLLSAAAAGAIFAVAHASR